MAPKLCIDFGFVSISYLADGLCGSLAAGRRGHARGDAAAAHVHGRGAQLPEREDLFILRHTRVHTQGARRARHAAHERHSRRFHIAPRPDRPVMRPPRHEACERENLRAEELAHAGGGGQSPCNDVIHSNGAGGRAIPLLIDLLNGRRAPVASRSPMSRRRALCPPRRARTRAG